jgi:hypothetical protein
MTSRFERQHKRAMRLQRRIAASKEHTMSTGETILTQDPHQTRREKFIKKQTAQALAFELLEKVATAVADAAAPLSVEAREQQSSVHIHIRGAAGLPDIRLELDGRGISEADEDEQCEWWLAAVQLGVRPPPSARLRVFAFAAGISSNSISPYYGLTTLFWVVTRLAFPRFSELFVHTLVRLSASLFWRRVKKLHLEAEVSLSTKEAAMKSQNIDAAGPLHTRVLVLDSGEELSPVSKVSRAKPV